MKIIKIEEMISELQKAVAEAKEFAKRADSKYYKYNVCAMLIDEDGNKFVGVNWEPANGATVCGEVGAIASYVMSDRKPIRYIITYGYPKEGVGREDSFCLPCGSCRQRLLEYVNKDTVCYGINEVATKAEEVQFTELLPYAFSSANL